MNNEIKEILDNFEKYEARYKLHNETQFIITHREIEPLLDYITNLQQLCNEYEEEHNNEFQCWKRDRKELLDKRGKIQKAIEYIENPRHEMSVLTYQNLLNILQNGSDEE